MSTSSEFLSVFFDAFDLIENSILINIDIFKFGKCAVFWIQTIKMYETAYVASKRACLYESYVIL